MVAKALCTTALMLLGFGTLAAQEKTQAKEDSKPAPEHRRRPSDVVFLLIEMSQVDSDSAAELQLLYDVLRKLDVNKDGKIDAGELKKASARLVEDRVDHLFQNFDADKDGKISKAEAKGRILEHFDLINRSGDGFITRDELRQAIQSPQVRTEKKTPSDR